jgi:Predicted metalloendopeptidase
MRFVFRSVSLLAASAAIAGAQSSVPMPKALDPANMDTSVSACSDFFHYANGGWVKSHPIPAAYSRWGGFDELQEGNRTALLNILSKAAKNHDPRRSAVEKKIGAFYASCMDSAGIEKAGAKPLASEIARINAIRDRASLEREIANLHSQGTSSVFSFRPTQDARNSTSVIAGIGQGGLGLPDRDYYTKTDPASVKLRENYRLHVAKMLELLGDNPAVADKESHQVMDIETKLANASLTRVQRRDPVANYHKMTLADLDTLTPGFNWKAFLTAQGRSDVNTFDVGSPGFMKTVNGLLSSEAPDAWKAYLKWHLVDGAATRLSSAFVNEDFAFNSANLTGAKEQLSRDKRCVRATDQALGDALGQAYVAATFPPSARARALSIVNNLQSVFSNRISALSWMSDSTKAAAHVKLAAFTKKIGYADKWKDYAGVPLSSSDYFGNLKGLTRYEYKLAMAKIGKPVDRTEFGMTPPTVNAYYNPAMNEIVFPAGILQPPFFNPTADDAVNYGAIGAVIGHEMTHGFDDQGAQYDPQGNLKNWWSAQDLALFKQRTTQVADQYSGYTVLDSVHVNGRLTLGENLADYGGLNIAYTAMENALAKNGRPANIDGFTPEQRFFLGFAQIWRENIRPETARVRINTDPHSPAIWRVNGPLSNMPEFAAAFGCKPGDAMVRPDSVRPVIW